jgi:hypothetical protein
MQVQPMSQLPSPRRLRADGEAAHKAGKHDDSMMWLGEPKKLLGI